MSEDVLRLRTPVGYSTMLGARGGGITPSVGMPTFGMGMRGGFSMRNGM